MEIFSNWIFNYTRRVIILNKNRCSKDAWYCCCGGSQAEATSNEIGLCRFGNEKISNGRYSLTFFHAQFEWDETHPNVLTLPTKSMSSISQRCYWWRWFQCVLRPFPSSKIQCSEREKLPHSSRPRQQNEIDTMIMFCGFCCGFWQFAFFRNESKHMHATSTIDCKIHAATHSSVRETSIALRDDWFSLIVRDNVLRCRKCYEYRLWWQRTDRKWQSLN